MLTPESVGSINLEGHNCSLLGTKLMLCNVICYFPHPITFRCLFSTSAHCCEQSGLVEHVEYENDLASSSEKLDNHHHITWIFTFQITLHPCSDKTSFYPALIVSPKQVHGCAPIVCTVAKI